MEVCDLESSVWFPPLVEQVQAKLESLAADRHQQRPALQKEWDDMQAKIQGWSQSLAKPNLDPEVRAAIEAQWGAALTRQREIENCLAEEKANRNSVGQAFDRHEVVKRLNRLEDVLATNNPTLGNLELSLHIDRIDAFPDGRVVMRTSKLGALAGATSLIRREGGDCSPEQAAPGGDGLNRVPPRRRARLRVDDPIDADSDPRAAVDTAIDPHRFAGMDVDWFWEDTFQVPEPTCWAKENAAEVARVRAMGLTIAKLALHFGKAIPTIRSALGYAADADESVRQLPQKMPRRRWTEVHAAEVAALKADGMSTTEIAERFGKCASTIREAVVYARRRLASETGSCDAAANDLGARPSGEPQAGDRL